MVCLSQGFPFLFFSSVSFLSVLSFFLVQKQRERVRERERGAIFCVGQSIVLGFLVDRLNKKKKKNTNSMCFKTTCSECKLATWAGCGNHKENALRGLKLIIRWLLSPGKTFYIFRLFVFF